MLYKKYHRNFVRKFRKGVEFKWVKDGNYTLTRTVITEPFVELNSTTRSHYIIIRATMNDIMILVHYSGRLYSNILIEDVI